jgi:hypothetical protein
MKIAFLYVDDVRTSLEAQTSTARYGYSLTFFFVEDFRITQETHLLAFTVCYGNSFIFCTRM